MRMQQNLLPVCLLATLLVGCSQNDSSGTSVPVGATVAPSSSPQATPSASPTFNPVPSATPVASATPGATSTPGQSATPSPTPTGSPDVGNQAPVAQSASFSSAEDNAIEAQLSGSDPDGDSLSFQQVGSAPGNGSLTLNPDGAFTFEPQANFNGSVSFQFRVSDGVLQSQSATVSLSFSAVNDFPLADAGAPQSVRSQDQVNLNGSGSDLEGAVSFAWNQVSGPAASVQNADQAQASFTAPDVDSSAELVFRLTVSDADGAQASDTTTVTVSPLDAANLPPAADAGMDQSVEEGSEVSLDARNSSDQDGEITAYSWSQLDNGAPMVVLRNADAALASFTAPSDVPLEGLVLRFELQVTDNAGASGTDQVDIEVNGNLQGVFRVGAAKRSVTPGQNHIDGIDEPRAGSAPHKQRFNLGGFGIDPTQNFPDPIGGFGDQLTAPAEQRVHQNAQGEDENIWVRALALSLLDDQNDDTTLVFLTLDAVGAGNVIQQDLKAAVVAATGLEPNNVVFGQTHSHAGPDLQGLWGGVPQDWIQTVLYPQAVAAVKAAVAQQRPARLSLDQQINNDYNNYRRTRVDPNAEADGHVTVLQARDVGNGDLLGHVLQYAAHPTSINEDPRVPHPDYVLGAVEWLESQGGVALYYNGPIADASGSSSRPGCEISNDDDFRAYESVHCRGEGIAELVAPQSSSKLSVTALPAALSVTHTEVALPVTNPMFVAAGLIGAFNRYYDFVGLPGEQIPGVGPLVADQLINLPQLTPTATTLVSRIQIGGENGLEIATIPGEATNTFGEYIRSLAPGKPMMLLGLTQNSFGYILPEEEFSYIDNAGVDGFFLPFTGYEEFVSLGPLTAPLLKLQGYNQLYNVDVSELPQYLAACVDDPRNPACILNIQGQRLELTQRALAQQCTEFGAPAEFCGLLNPDTPLRPLCDTLGFSQGICGLLGQGGDGGPQEPLPDNDYGSGLLGLLGQTTADTNPVLTALLDTNPEAAAQHAQNALENLADGISDGVGNFDPARPGETLLGTDVPLTEAGQRALASARDSSPVVLTGQQLPGWSVPAAQGVGYPYPSGAIQSGVLLDPFDIGQVRNAHNGEILYPVAGSLGASGLVDVSQIAAYRYDATADEFVEIPVQVDERAPYFLANAGSDFSVYSGTDPELSYVWNNGDTAHSWGEESWMMVDGVCERAYPPGVSALPDPVAGLDDDDEIVFMASDAGDLYTALEFPEDWQAVQMINVVDPLAPQLQRVVYLVVRDGGSSFNPSNGYIDYQRRYEQDGVQYNSDQWIDKDFFASSDPEKLGTSNRGYGANLSGTVCPDGTPGSARNSDDRFPRDGITVATDTYRFKASGRWMIRDLRIRPEGGEVSSSEQWESRPDLLDRWKGRAFQQSPDSVISLVGFEDEQVNWEGNSSLIGERCGAVRCIREVWGADSGTNVTKTESFYRDAISYHYRVRVHPIPADGLYTSWDYNRSAMVPAAGEDVAGGRYYTMLRPQGVPIDGRNDDIGNVDGYAPIPVAECVGSDGLQPPASSGRCPAFFDVADPSFNIPLAFNNWEQVAGKGDSGSLVYSFELVGLTSLANPLVVPYYRDDACLDDGTGDDPVVRPWPGESYDWNGGTVRQAYDANAGRALDYSGEVFADCVQRQGAHASHGVHYFVTHDSDNAFTPLSTTEIDARQWQYIVPTSTPKNIGEPYANNVRVPLVVVALPLSAPPTGEVLGLPGLGGGASQASCNTPAPAGLQPLLGAIHEHTGYSDGDIGTTPADVFAAGLVNGMDYVMVTDHSDNARLPITASTDCLSEQLPDCLQLSPEGLLKWETTAAMADEASVPGQYTGVRGFEWTSDRFGHINVLFSQHHINAKTGTGYLVSMEDFWLWLALPSALGGGDDGIAIFNHPGREDMFHSFVTDPAYAFNDFEYRAEADAQLVGLEMYGKSGDYYDGDNGAPAGGWYAYALDKGWHVGPIGAEDEHGREWTKPERAKTVLLAPDRSRASLKNALRAQRFYALAHEYQDLRLSYTAQLAGSGDMPMGSRIAGAPGSVVTFDVAINGVGSPRIEIVGPGGRVLESANLGSTDFTVSLDSEQESYRFVRVIDLADQDADGRSGEVVAVSAPIWFRSGSAYPACVSDSQPPSEIPLR